MSNNLYQYISGSSSTGRLNTESYFPFHFIDLNCAGDEDSIWNCPSNNLTQYSCLFYNDAAVACQEGTTNCIVVIITKLLQLVQYNILIVLMDS